LCGEEKVDECEEGVEKEEEEEEEEKILWQRPKVQSFSGAQQDETNL
jgi:hypothetical protein